MSIVSRVANWITHIIGGDRFDWDDSDPLATPDPPIVHPEGWDDMGTYL